MRAFDFVMTLYSFVYALGVAQILATVGDMVRAGKRLRFSWLNAGWMLNVLLAIVAWWLSLWDLRAEANWPMLTVLVLFAVACLLYLLARLVSAPIPKEGTVDLQQYHQEEGRKYAGLFAVEVALTIATVFLYGSSSQNWAASNEASWPTLAASLAAAITGNRWVQSVALLVILAMWVWYFATLESALA
ncbi:MAG: hypothetical protein WBQ17_09030 [Rhizomicrobium sp.]